MARLKIRLPGPSLFSTELTVRVTDLNYGGHLANDSVLTLCHEVRVRFLRSRGLRELDNGGIGLIMSDSGVEYKSQARLGEKLTCQVAIDDLRDVGFDVFYELRAEDGRLVARVKTGHVGFDYKARKLAKMPEVVRERLGMVVEPA